VFEKCTPNDIPSKVIFSKMRRFPHPSNFIYMTRVSKQDGVRYVLYNKECIKMDGRTFRLLKKAIRENPELGFDDFIIYQRAHILTKL
jgi:hypothetical protein